jgi:hypothetical protein
MQGNSNNRNDAKGEAKIVKLQPGEARAHIASDLPLRQWLYAWLLDPKIAGNYHKGVDRWVGLLIVANLLALLFEHLPAVYVPYQQWFHLFDVFSVGIFTVEYLLRLYLAPEDPEFQGSSRPRLRYIRSPFAVIDLLAIAPFYLQAFVPVDLRVLRFLRLLRILKLFRVLAPAWQEFTRLNQGRTFRQKMHALVYPSEFGGTLHGLFDSFIMVWVLVSVAAVILESVQSISLPFSLAIERAWLASENTHSSLEALPHHVFLGDGAAPLPASEDTAAQWTWLGRVSVGLFLTITLLIDLPCASCPG